MIIKTPEFTNGQTIPQKYTCDGDDINPALDIVEIPQNAKELALIVDDPDAPSGNWVHWVVYNIPVINLIKENSNPGTQGINDFKRTGYGGPCPKSGVHHYLFKLYALDEKLNLDEGLSKEELMSKIEGHIIDKAELSGSYSH